MRKDQGMHLLAFDLGAESGRAVLGTLSNGRLDIAELHRFPNRMVRVGGHVYWDLWNLLADVRSGLAIAAGRVGTSLASVGIDTWGVDFGLLASDGSVLGLPYSYRDPRTDGVLTSVLRRVAKERIYNATGIQFLPINTLYQLYSMVRDKSPQLAAASDLLFMPDLINYLLTGEKVTEFTIATTSQLFDTTHGQWATGLFRDLGLPRRLMQDAVAPGTRVGHLCPEVCAETGAGKVPVIATASHDTAAAVAAIPAEGDDWVFVSAGTWSLVGTEVPKPVKSRDALRYNFTNEGGVGGRYRLLKNVTGFWLLQGLLRSWRSRPDFAGLTSAAAAVRPLRSIVDPDGAGFRDPADMAGAIAAFCRKTKQPVPRTRAEFARCVFDSLALKYRLVIEELKQVCARPLHRVHIVGGGSRNRLLCQLAADATGLPVLAGPAEATAIGNILVQALGHGRVSSLSEIRRIVARSFETERFSPNATPEWDRAYERFHEIAGD
jgi:rhamnulokinase